jgi:hypothetical protein
MGVVQDMAMAAASRAVLSGSWLAVMRDDIDPHP